MTTPRRDGGGTAFEQWCRENQRIDSKVQRIGITDCDEWFHQYRAHTDKVGSREIDSIMLVEVKSFNARLPFSQRDTLQIISACHAKGFIKKNGQIKPVRIEINHEVRLVRWYGVFLLQMSSDRPDTSDNIKWHGKQVDINMLLDILSFDRNPRTLRMRSERRHHQGNLQIHLVI